MEINNQSQKAGDNSTLMQASTINNYTIIGIDENQARDICKQQCAIAIQNWSIEANKLANERIQKLEDKVLPLLAAHDKSLQCFANPSFQIAIRKAQISAACSEEENNIDILADLLLHRVQQSNNKERVLGITKAIEIADQVSPIAIVGLSLYYAIDRFKPISNDIEECIDAMENLYGNIIGDITLPRGNEWLEHLDLLSAVRLSNFRLALEKFKEYFPTKWNEKFPLGIKADSDEYQTFINEFQRVELPLCFIKNPLKDGYMIMQPTIAKDVEDICLINGAFKKELNPHQKDVMSKALERFNCSGAEDSEIQETFIKKWNERDILRKISEWWNALGTPIFITPLGVALTNAYIHGKDPSAPCIY